MPGGTARELRVCALLSVSLAALQWWPALAQPAATGFGDWQMIHHNWEAARVALVRFREWPLWDPFHCGGVPILGNPESQLYAPWFWLSLALGSVLAVKLMLIGHIACAAAGMYWLARRCYQLHPAAAALAAVAWSCGGCFVWDGAGGHATFLSFAFAPWLSYFVQRGAEPSPRKDAAAVALLLLLSLLEGGTYPLPFFVIWIAFELGVRAVRLRRLRPSLEFAAISFGLLALCGAIRFVPIYLTLQAHPRQVPNRDALSLGEVWTMLTARSHAWRMPGHPFVWPEYGSYVGVTVTLLAVLGAPLALWRKRYHLLAGLVLYLALMLGNLGAYAPYSLLHRLPIYDSLRVPSRFAVFVTFYVALLAAHSVDAALRALPHPRGRAALGALAALAVCVDLLSASWPLVKLWREPPLSDAAPAREFHLVKRPYYRFYASYPRLNLGTPTCYVGGMNWRVSPALWLGEQPQLRIAEGAGRLVSWRRSPNRFQATLSLQTPARVLFNQNFARGFESSAGTLTQSQGLLALDLPAGERSITLRYRPPELLASAAISVMGLLLLLSVLFWPRRTPRL